MDKIVCPKCGKEINISVSNAIDENGEVYKCPHCNWKVRYAIK